VKRLLVIELTKLGDVVSCLPFFPSLKEFVPKASIVVLVQSQYASLFPFVQGIDEVLIPDPSRGVWGLMKSIQHIRQQGFDLVVSASPSVRHGLLVLLSGARYKFGFLEYSRGKVVHLQPHRVRSLGFQLQASSVGILENMNERVGHLCRCLGVAVPERKPTLALLRVASAPEPRVEKRLLPANGSSYIVVHPFTGWEYRTWPIENFRSLVRAILEASTEHVVLVGAESDKGPLQALVTEFGRDPRVSFEIGLELDSLARMIANARLFIGGDSGPLHLAAAVGTPSVGLFGPAPPELTGSPMPMESHVYKRVECSPCDQETCVRKWAPCMTLITVDEVFDTAGELLAPESKERSRPAVVLPKSSKSQRPLA
jgi:ADP-heptose:LPS heptosyltransferase